MVRAKRISSPNYISAQKNKSSLQGGISVRVEGSFYKAGFIFQASLIKKV